MKAILVIDMPTNCGDCPLIGVFGNNTSWRCVALDKDIEDENDEYFITRPKWCPLKPMPDPKDVGYPNDDYDVGFGDGWDACLKEIEK